MSVANAEQKLDIKVDWRAFALHPDVPADGIGVRAYFGWSADQLDRESRRLTLMAERLGLPFQFPAIYFNSERAQEVTAWARIKVVDASTFHDAMFRAYWADGADISDPAVLIDVVASLGLDGEAAGEALQRRTYARAVRSDHETAQRSHIRGVPTMVVGRQLIVGAQPPDTLHDALVQAGALLKR